MADRQSRRLQGAPGGRQHLVTGSIPRTGSRSSINGMETFIADGGSNGGSNRRSKRDQKMSRKDRKRNAEKAQVRID